MITFCILPSNITKENLVVNLYTKTSLALSTLYGLTTGIMRVHAAAAGSPPETNYAGKSEIWLLIHSQYQSPIWSSTAWLDLNKYQQCCNNHHWSVVILFSDCCHVSLPQNIVYTKLQMISSGNDLIDHHPLNYRLSTARATSAKRLGHTIYFSQVINLG